MLICLGAFWCHTALSDKTLWVWQQSSAQCTVISFVHACTVIDQKWMDPHHAPLHYHTLPHPSQTRESNGSEHSETKDSLFQRWTKSTELEMTKTWFPGLWTGCKVQVQWQEAKLECEQVAYQKTKIYCNLMKVEPLILPHTNIKSMYYVYGKNLNLIIKN